jgi:hypothetical protein
VLAASALLLASLVAPDSAQAICAGPAGPDGDPLQGCYDPPPPPPPPPPGTPDYAPYGWHGDITPDGYVRGWACDPNDFNYPIFVHFYFNGVYAGQDQAEDWWNEGVAGACGGNPWHGYRFRIPDAYRNGLTYQIASYAINICGSSCYQGNTQQQGDGAYFNIAPPAPVYTSLPCDGNPGVYLYRDANYSGGCSRFASNQNNATTWSIGDNTVSSVKIVGNYTAELYQHPDYAGPWSEFVENSAGPTGWEVGNDTVSSVRVVPVPADLYCEYNNTCAGTDAFTLQEDSAYTPFESSNIISAYGYSLSSCPAAYDKEIDPVGIVFYGSATGARTMNHIRYHTGWPIKPTLHQNFSSWGVCGKTYDEAASGRWYHSRYHVRVRKTARRTSLVGTTTLSTPHHEDYLKGRSIHPFCTHPVDKGGVGPNGGGLMSGFTQGRDELFSRMVSSSHHNNTAWVQWGNTREFRQCDGDYAGGDGWVVYVLVPNWSH